MEKIIAIIRLKQTAAKIVCSLEKAIVIDHAKNHCCEEIIIDDPKKRGTQSKFKLSPEIPKHEQAEKAVNKSLKHIAATLEKYADGGRVRVDDWCEATPFLGAKSTIKSCYIIAIYYVIRIDPPIPAEKLIG
jgi:hypothetical protein